MITIAASQIRKFIDKCSDIPNNKILPIYSYVKLICKKDGSQLIKHCGHRFLIMDIDTEFKNEQTLMIETKPFFGFAKFSRGGVINISVKGNNVILDDTERKISCQTTSDLYPTIEDNSQAEKFEIPIEAKESLNIAKNHTLQSSERVLRAWNFFVHIRKIKDKYYIIGTRGDVTYFKGFKDVLPEISLEPETISCLNGKQLTYSSVGSYDYFESFGSVYGFLKPETKCSEAVDRVLENFKSDKSFYIEKDRIINFCEMVNAVNDTAIQPEIIFAGKENDSVALRFTEITDNVKAQEVVPVNDKTFEFDECLFSPRNLLTALKGVKADKIKVSYAHHNFIFTDDNDEDYIGAVMELSKILKQ